MGNQVNIDVIVSFYIDMAICPPVLIKGIHACKFAMLVLDGTETKHTGWVN